MSYTTLTILARSAQEAVLAAASIPRQRDLKRFFVLLGPAPEPAALAWVQHPDAYLCLDNVMEHHPEPAAVGVRAGLLYGGGWNLLFCYAEDPPSDSEIENAIEKLQSESSFTKESRLWGATREYLMLQGMGEIQPGPTPVDTVEAPVSPMETAQAMAGMPCRLSVIKMAVTEVIPLKGMSLDATARNPQEPFRDLMEHWYSKARSIDDEFPTTLLVGSKISLEHLYYCLSRIPKMGAVVLPTNEPDKWVDAVKPYRRFKIDTGGEILIFGAVQNE